MEVLTLKILHTAILIFLCSFGFIKFAEYDELPFWIASTAVFLLFGSAVISFFTAIIVIWS